MHAPAAMVPARIVYDLGKNPQGDGLTLTRENRQWSMGFDLASEPDRTGAAILFSDGQLQLLRLFGGQSEGTMADFATNCLRLVQSDQYQDLTLRQIALLAIICDHGERLAVRGLAKMLGVQKSIITRGADKLVALGFAKRVRGLEDRRDIFIEPTPAGVMWRNDLRGLA